MACLPRFGDFVQWIGPGELCGNQEQHLSFLGLLSINSISDMFRYKSHKKKVRRWMNMFERYWWSHMVKNWKFRISRAVGPPVKACKRAILSYRCGDAPRRLAERNPVGCITLGFGTSVMQAFFFWLHLFCRGAKTWKKDIGNIYFSRVPTWWLGFLW